MRIVCLGDSNTWGYDPRSRLGSRYPEEIRWTARLRREGREILNAGENGRSVPSAAEVPALARLARGADAVIVMLGTNDLLRGCGAAETASRMEALLRALRVAGAPRLLLTAPPPLRRGEWVSDESLIRESERLGEAYRALAEELCVAFADAGEWDVETAFDGVHFSPEGHAAFARGVDRALHALPGEE